MLCRRWTWLCAAGALDRASCYTTRIAGCQYVAYQAALSAAGIAASMSRRGQCLDNAVAESFFATLKSELVEGRAWRTRHEAGQAIFEWIEVFYNRHRLHSTLGYTTRAEYEACLREGEPA